MTKQKDPLYWIGAEIIAILFGLVLINRYGIQILSDSNAVVLALAAGVMFWWGYSNIEESDHTHSHLAWHRVLVPTTRATRQAIEDTARKVPALNLLFYAEEELDAQRQAKEIVEDFETTAFKELEMDDSYRLSGEEQNELISEIATETTLFKRDGYRRIANVAFSDCSADEKEIRLILILCREHVKADDVLNTGETIHDIKSAITRALSASSCDFEDENEATRTLLTAYGAAFDAIHHGDSISGDPLDGESEKDLNECYQSFGDFLPFRDRNTLSKELVSTVIEVVDRGELDQSAVAKDVHDLIEDEKNRIRAKFEGRSAYLLMSWGGVLSKSRGFENRERLREKYPNHIDFGGKQNYSDVSDLPEGIILTFHIIFTERPFQSTQQFLDDALTIIPDAELEGGFITAYELEVSDARYEPSRDEIEALLPNDAQEQLDLIDFLETGTGSRAITETAIDNLLGRKIEVRELLAAIPANVFVEATPKQENAFNEAYKPVKEALEISDLYDWGRYDPEDLTAEFEQVETEEDVSSEEWLEITTQVVEGARKCERVATA